MVNMHDFIIVPDEKTSENNECRTKDFSHKILHPSPEAAPSFAIVSNTERKMPVKARVIGYIPLDRGNRVKSRMSKLLGECEWTLLNPTS